MTGIDRDALLAVVRANVNRLQDGRVISDDEFVDRILALVEPVAFTRDRVRTELAASLPADPKWATWVDGVLDRLEEASS